MEKQTKIVAIYGSPRRSGNSSTLLAKAVEGARGAGGVVEEVFLRDLRMSPCLEIYGCKKDGRCAIKDDFQKVYDLLDSSTGIILASPIFFYAVSAATKILMDRCQSFWVRKNWLEKDLFSGKIGKHGLFISVGATGGKKLFDGALLSVRYWLEALDAELWDKLLYRGLDFEGDVLNHPEYLDEAFAMGSRFCKVLQEG